jgi:hypothetical protein
MPTFQSAYTRKAVLVESAKKEGDDIGPMRKKP